MVEPTTPPNPADGQGPRSVPDPTLLTIDALRREIAQLEASMEKGFDAAEKLVEKGFDAADRLTSEKFRRVDDLMEKAEEQRREQKQDTASAVDAALDSQKEATSKMEKSISDQVKSLESNFGTEIRSIRSSMSDLKDGMTRLESIKIGQIEQKTEARQVSAGMVALIGLGVAILLAVLTVIGFFAAMG